MATIGGLESVTDDTSEQASLCKDQHLKVSPEAIYLRDIVKILLECVNIGRIDIGEEGMDFLRLLLACRTGSSNVDIKSVMHHSWLGQGNFMKDVSRQQFVAASSQNYPQGLAPIVAMQSESAGVEGHCLTSCATKVETEGSNLLSDADSEPSGGEDITESNSVQEDCGLANIQKRDRKQETLIKVEQQALANPPKKVETELFQKRSRVYEAILAKKQPSDQRLRKGIRTSAGITSATYQGCVSSSAANYQALRVPLSIEGNTKSFKEINEGSVGNKIFKKFPKVPNRAEGPNNVVTLEQSQIKGWRWWNALKTLREIFLPQKIGLFMHIAKQKNSAMEAPRACSRITKEPIENFLRFALHSPFESPKAGNYGERIYNTIEAHTQEGTESNNPLPKVCYQKYPSAIGDAGGKRSTQALKQEIVHEIMTEVYPRLRKDLKRDMVQSEKGGIQEDSTLNANCVGESRLDEAACNEWGDFTPVEAAHHKTAYSTKRTRDSNLGRGYTLGSQQARRTAVASVKAKAKSNLLAGNVYTEEYGGSRRFRLAMWCKKLDILGCLKGAAFKSMGTGRVPLHIP